MNKFFTTIKGTCPYVLLFGGFVIISLLLQCFIPFLQKMTELRNGEWAWFLSLFNSQFHLPMEMISNFWAAISATYVGLDRAAYTIDAFKSGNDNYAFDPSRMKQLTQVMFLSLVIYIMAVALNTFFDAELALLPLFVSFGSSVLCYVAGNKAVVAFSELSTQKEENILEGLNDSQKQTMTKISGLLKGKQLFTIKIDKDANILGMTLK